jgi:hypothetical protein
MSYKSWFPHAIQKPFGSKGTDISPRFDTKKIYTSFTVIGIFMNLPSTLI